MYTRAIFVQVSSAYGGNTNPVLSHLSKVLPEVGLPYNPDFLEHPTWISWVSGIMRGRAYIDEQFVLIKDAADVWKLAVKLFTSNPSTKYLVFGSVLDANKQVWKDIVHSLLGDNVEVVLGGYINPSELSLESAHVRCHWLKSLAELERFGGDINAAPNHELLQQFEALPRLTMSSGCLFRCSFCTIAPTVKAVEFEAITAQVMSMQGLRFQYIYLDDKTFGQCENWKSLGVFNDMVRSFNPKFKGFIVQTTVNELLEHYDDFLGLGVVMAEIGVEIPDDEFLTRMNKPYRVHSLDKLMRFQRQRMSGSSKVLKIIPNLLFGVPGDDYKTTLSWLKCWRREIGHVNFFILSFYEDAKNPTKLVQVHGQGDDDENSSSRTWLTQAEVQNLEDSMAEAMAVVEGEWGV